MDASLPIKNIESSSIADEKIATITRLGQSISSGKSLTAEEKAKAEKAARGFESLFVNMMLKEMKKSQLEDTSEKEDSFGADTLQGYTDLLLSDQISRNGKGIGIADQIYRALTGEGISSNADTSASNYSSSVFPKLTSTTAPETASNNSTSTDEVKKYFGGDFLDRVKSRLGKYDEIISSASKTYDVPESLIKAIITTESAGRSDAKSSVGAKGLMQLMDSTAKDLGVSDSYDPAQNIKGGTKYIKQMLDKFDGNINLALAAYNAGPGNVAKYNGVPPFSETKAYVAKVRKYLDAYRSEDIVSM